jgi:hypothetical protein
MAELPDLEESYFTKFDQVQAYELFAREEKREEHIKELQSELKKLFNYHYMSSTVDVEKEILKISNMLEEFISYNPSNVKGEIDYFVHMKNRDANIDEIVIDMLTQIKNRINVFVTAMKCRSNKNVNEYITPKQQTEEGKLVKEKNCLLCNSVFKSKRSDAKYCSSKCKQAAYREKKSS